jgi:hypothetical protein
MKMSNITYAVLRDRLENLKDERSTAAKNYRLAGRNKYDDPDGTIALLDQEIVKVENQIDEMIK